MVGIGVQQERFVFDLLEWIILEMTYEREEGEERDGRRAEPVE